MDIVPVFAKQIASNISGMWVDDLSNFEYFCGFFHFGEVYLCGVDLVNRVLRLGFGKFQSMEGCTIRFLVTHVDIMEEGYGIHELGLLELQIETENLEIKCKTKIKSRMSDMSFEETSWYKEKNEVKFSEEAKLLFTDLAKKCTQNTPTGSYTDGNFSINIYGLATPTPKEFIKNFKHRPFQVAVLSFGTRNFQRDGIEFLTVGFGSWETGLVPSKPILWINQSQLYRVESSSDRDYYPTIFSYEVNPGDPEVMKSNHRKYKGEQVHRSDNVTYIGKLSNPSSIQLLPRESTTEEMKQLHSLLNSIWVLNRSKCIRSKLCKSSCPQGCRNCCGIPSDYFDVFDVTEPTFNRDSMGSLLPRDSLLDTSNSDKAFEHIGRRHDNTGRAVRSRRQFSRNILFGSKKQ